MGRLFETVYLTFFIAFNMTHNHEGCTEAKEKGSRGGFTFEYAYSEQILWQLKRHQQMLGTNVYH